jgi:hypothetical protein
LLLNYRKKIKKKKLKKLEKKGSDSAKGGGLNHVTSTGRASSSSGRSFNRTSGRSLGSLGSGSSSTRGNGNRGRDRSSLALVRITKNGTLLLESVPRRAVKKFRVRLNGNTALNNLQTRGSSVIKATKEANGTTNALDKRETKNRLKLSVVGNLETTANSLKTGERSVGKLTVRNNGKGTTNLTQLGNRDRRDGVVGEGKSRVDGGNVRKRKRRNITQSNVVSPLQVREGNMNIATSRRKLENVGNRSEVKVKSGQKLVVVNVKSINGHERNTFKGLDGSVGNNEGLGLGDASIKLESVQNVKGDERNVANGSELGERDSGERLKNLKRESTSNVGEKGGRNGVEGGDVFNNQVTINGLNTIDAGGGDVALKDNVTLKNRAGGDTIKVRLRRDSQRRRADVAGAAAGATGAATTGGRRGYNKELVAKFTMITHSILKYVGCLGVKNENKTNTF